MLIFKSGLKGINLHISIIFYAATLCVLKKNLGLDAIAKDSFDFWNIKFMKTIL